MGLMFSRRRTKAAKAKKAAAAETMMLGDAGIERVSDQTEPQEEIAAPEVVVSKKKQTKEKKQSKQTKKGK